MMGSGLYPGPGLPIDQKDYGVIDKCPYCDETNIVRSRRNQDSCPKESCKSARRRKYYLKKKAGLTKTKKNGGD